MGHRGGLAGVLAALLVAWGCPTDPEPDDDDTSEGDDDISDGDDDSSDGDDDSTAGDDDSTGTDDLTVSTGDGLDVTFDPEGRVVSVQLNGTELVSAPQALLRATVRLHSDRADNLLPDAALEDSDGDGALDGWTGVADFAVLDFVPVPRVCETLPDDGSPFPGDHAMRFEAIPGTGFEGIHRGGIASVWVEVQPGDRFRVSAWVQASRGYLGTDSENPQDALWTQYLPDMPASGIHVQWADEGEPSTDDRYVVAPFGRNARECKRIGGMITAPPGATRMRIELWAALDEVHADEGVVEAVLYDEVIVAPVPDLVVDGNGTFSPSGDDVSGNVAFDGADLEITDLSVTGGSGRILVEGTLVDLTAGERAVELSVGLPLDLAGFEFAATPRDSALVDPAIVQEHSLSAAASAAMPVSMYPLVSVDDPAVGTLALHLPRDGIQFARLRHDGPVGRLEASFRLGLSTQPAALPSRAPFRVELLASPAGLGWRGAWAHARQVHEADHPTWYRATHATMHDYEAFHQTGYEANAELALDHDQEGIYSAEYVHVPVVDVLDLGPEPPDYDALLDHVAWLELNGDSAAIRAYYAAFDTSVARDDNGDVVWRGMSEKGGSFRGGLLFDPDPQIADSIGAWYMGQDIGGALDATEAIGACLDGVEFDNFCESNLDYEPAHVALARHPLTFTEAALRPGKHSLDGLWSFLEHLRGELDAYQPGACTAPGLSFNWWAPGTPGQLSPWFDFMVGESRAVATWDSTDHRGMWKDEMILARRALAHDKFLGLAIKRDFGGTDDEEEVFCGVMEKSLLYATELRRWEDVEWDPSLVSSHEGVYQPLVRELQSAGWEPVPHTSADLAGIHVERYGDTGDGDLRIVYLNRTDAETSFTITVDRAALGLDPPAEVLDRIRGDEVLPFQDTGDQIVIEDTLGPDRGRMLAFVPAACAD